MSAMSRDPLTPLFPTGRGAHLGIFSMRSNTKDMIKSGVYNFSIKVNTELTKNKDPDEHCDLEPPPIFVLKMESLEVGNLKMRSLIIYDQNCSVTENLKKIKVLKYWWN